MEWARRRSDWILAGLLGLVLAAVYANSFAARLTLDNKIVLLRDPRLSGVSWSNLRLIFSENYWWPSFPSDLYRPLTTLSYWANFNLGHNGPRPGAYHVVNFLLHWANAVLMAAWIRRVGGGAGAAWVAALVFGVHPAAVESVTNIVGRADLFAAGWVLAALHCAVSAAQVSTRRARWGWQGALALAALAGVLSKESVVMLAVLVPLQNWLLLDRPLRFATPALIPAVAAFAAARVWIAAASVVPWQYFVDNPIARATPWQGFMTAARVQGEYLRLLCWPARLTCDYSYDHVPLYGTAGPWVDAGAWAALLLLIGLGIGLWRCRARAPLAAFAGGLYFATLFPTSNLAKTIGSIMAERFLYLPLIGFALAAGLGWEWVRRQEALSRPVRRLIPWLLASMLVALAVRTVVRNRDWRDDRALWSSAVAVAPDSFKTHKGMAETLFREEPTEQGTTAAIAEAERGLAILDRAEIDGRIERRDVTLFIDLGHYYKAKADWCAARGDGPQARAFGAKAVAVLRRALAVDMWVNQESRRMQLDRGVKPEAVHDVGRPDLHQALAMVLFQSERFPEAIRSAYAAARLEPEDAGAWFFIARCERAQRLPDRAVVSDLIALLINGRFMPAWRDLSAAYAEAGEQGGLVRETAPEDFQLAGDSARVKRDLATAAGLYDHFMREGNYTAQAAQFRGFMKTYFHLAPWDPGAVPSAKGAK